MTDQSKRKIVMGYYLGTSFKVLPEKRLPVANLLALRIVDAERFTVVEEIYREDRLRQNSAAERYYIRFHQKDERILFREENGHFKGEGVFTKSVGDWDYITLEAKFTNGVRVEIEDKFEPGKLWAHKAVFMPDGNSIGEYIEEGFVITQEEFEEKKSKLKHFTLQ